jgi:drug/metabolite transporter (DMT)-like permease
VDVGGAGPVRGAHPPADRRAAGTPLRGGAGLSARSRPGDLVGVAAACSSAFLGGTAAVATRFLVGGTDPLTVALLRYGIAALGLLALAGWYRRLRWRRADLPWVLGLGALMFTVFPLLFCYGLAYTTAARGTLALSTMPILTLLLARLVLGERLTARRILGVVLAMAGVAWALAGGPATVGAAGTGLGDLIMLGTAVVGAVYAVLCRRALVGRDPLAFTAQSALAGLVLLALLALTAGALDHLPGLGAGDWLVALYLGLVGGALSFWLWNIGLGRTSATNVAVAVTVNPVSAMLFGALLLAEPLTANLLGGFALVAGGIVLTALPAGISPRA